MIPVKRTEIRLKADPRKVILKFLDFGKAERFQQVIDAILVLDEATVEQQLKHIFLEFEHRHFNLQEAFLESFEKIGRHIPNLKASPSKQLLIGSYFTHEYSIQAAALFNPSIVPHPDQSGLPAGALRFLLYMRATGEGHISSITFQTGVIMADGQILLDPASPKLTCGRRVDDLCLSKDFFEERLPENNAHYLAAFPEEFTEAEAISIFAALASGQNSDFAKGKKFILKTFDENYDLRYPDDTPIDSQVLFPLSSAESNGMEDARFVLFQNGANHCYLGTYTAYNGKAIRPQLIETKDFKYFKIRPLHGASATDKGMALFPEKIKGKFAMIGRQGGRSLSIMFSEDLHQWEEHQPLQHPKRDWELLQMGNCGSPVKTPHGWLLLTHAVGPMRKYVLSLTLLDLENPERVIASLDQPLLTPNEEERDGYVPNVLYTCGMLLHHELLVIPYAMSDSAIGFATVELRDVLAVLKSDE